MKVVFDLDYTLLDTAKFKEALAEAVTSCGVSRERYEETYKAVVKREGKVYDYDPEVHLKLLRRDFPDDQALGQARERIDGVVAATDKFLFPGSLELLRELKTEKNKTVLLSLGNEKWQKRKIDTSGLGGHFDRVIATDKHKAGIIRSLLEQGEKTVVVNDNGEEIQEMMREAPEAVYILKRGPKPVPAELKVPEADSVADIERRLVEEGALKEARLESGGELRLESRPGGGPFRI